MPALKATFVSKSTHILVSIIITYIDEHAFLAEAVLSALAQKTIEKEIIVVCNAANIPNGYDPLPEHKYNFKLIQEPTPGSAYARNAGLNAAAGEWIQYLDVDDLILPLKIAHQLGHKKKGAIASPHIFRLINESTKFSKWMPEDIWCGMLNSGLGSTSSMLWHRESLIQIGGWSTEYHSHQEYELLFRLAAAGHHIECVGLRETIVRERIAGSITLQSQPVRAMEGIRLRETMWKHLVQRGLVTTARKNAFLQYIFRQLRGLYRLDREAALTIYKRYFSHEAFKPEHIGIPFYRLMHKTLGFNLTEKIFTKYSAVRDKYLPFLPVNR